MIFEEWLNNPYTKVLQDSIARDYVPRNDVAIAIADARNTCFNLCQTIRLRNHGCRIEPSEAYECEEAIMELSK